MLIELKNEMDILKVQAELLKVQSDLSKGKKIDIEIKEHREKRSLNANAYFHLLVDKLAKSLNLSAEDCKIRMVLDYGTIDSDEKGLKIGFKLLENIPLDKVCKYAKKIGTVVENGRKFNQYIVYKHTHEYNSKEMATLINGVVEECKQVGIETKTPNEIANLINLWEMGNG